MRPESSLAPANQSLTSDQAYLPTFYLNDIRIVCLLFKLQTGKQRGLSRSGLGTLFLVSVFLFLPFLSARGMPTAWLGGRETDE